MARYDVYTPEVDNKGIDFIVSRDGNYFEIQVKSIRIEKSKYVFMDKTKFDITKSNLYLSLVIFKEHEEPKIYLINRKAWKMQSEVFKEKKYEGKRSAPEWGINISKKNMDVLNQYQIENVIEEMGRSR